jgi:hypothetical protein
MESLSRFRPLNSREKPPRYPLKLKLDGPQMRYRRFDIEKNTLPYRESNAVTYSLQALTQLNGHILLPTHFLCLQMVSPVPKRTPSDRRYKLRVPPTCTPHLNTPVNSLVCTVLRELHYNSSISVNQTLRSTPTTRRSTNKPIPSRSNMFNYNYNYRLPI